ncbi:MAG: hypothetical protein ACWGQW_17750, partial [bacterium]
DSPHAKGDEPSFSGTRVMNKVCRDDHESKAPGIQDQDSGETRGQAVISHPLDSIFSRGLLGG